MLSVCIVYIHIYAFDPERPSSELLVAPPSRSLITQKKTFEMISPQKSSFHTFPVILHILKPRVCIENNYTFGTWWFSNTYRGSVRVHLQFCPPSKLEMDLDWPVILIDLGVLNQTNEETYLEIENKYI